MKEKIECDIVQDLLLGYVDKTLNNKSNKLVEEHLRECEKCRSKVDEIKQDIKENESNQKKEIDYLKKVRRKSIIKSIFIAIGLILLVFLISFLIRFIKITSITNKYEASLENNNFYKEERQIGAENKAYVTKTYFKDGKCKVINETYTDNGKEISEIRYFKANSDEEIAILPREDNRIERRKGELIKNFNSERFIKNARLVSDLSNSLYVRLFTAFCMEMNKDTFEVGREYYVLKNIFEPNRRWEIWIDKETGLPIKEINFSGLKQYYPGTDITKLVADNVQEYRYEFGKVTDEDVQIPDLTGKEIISINDDEINS